MSFGATVRQSFNSHPQCVNYIWIISTPGCKDVKQLRSLYCSNPNVEQDAISCSYKLVQDQVLLCLTLAPNRHHLSFFFFSVMEREFSVPNESS